MQYSAACPRVKYSFLISIMDSFGWFQTPLRWHETNQRGTVQNGAFRSILYVAWRNRKKDVFWFTSSLSNQWRQIEVAFQGGQTWNFCYRVVTLKTELDKIETEKNAEIRFKFKRLKLADKKLKRFKSIAGSSKIIRKAMIILTFKPSAERFWTYVKISPTNDRFRSGNMKMPPLQKGYIWRHHINAAFLKRLSTALCPNRHTNQYIRYVN